MGDTIQVVGIRGSDQYCPWCSSDTKNVVDGPYCNEFCEEKMYNTVKQKLAYTGQKPTISNVSIIAMNKPQKMLRMPERSVVTGLVKRLKTA